MNKELIRELRYVAEWAQHHLDKSKIVTDGADALEAQAARIAELEGAIDAIVFNGGTVQMEAHVRQAIRAVIKKEST
jgi:molybdopterin biosynthesis enzyme MoaB